MNKSMTHVYTAAIFLCPLFAVVFLAIPHSFAGMQEFTDIQYAQVEGVEPTYLSLDIYNTTESNLQPVMFYVHGGSWKAGDKGLRGSNMVYGLIDMGYVLVSANYRLSPRYDFPYHTKDLAAAIAWTYENIGDYGGDPDRIFLIGHSAGAHLVAHVAADYRYMEEYGLTLNVIKGVIPLDVSYYDIPLMASIFGGNLPALEDVFTQNPDFWEFASPIFHSKPGFNIPPMIVAYSNAQADPVFTSIFVDKLNYEGNRSALLAAPDKNHMTIFADFGNPDDHVTRDAMTFIESVSEYTRLKFSRDYRPGSLDDKDNFLGGTETTFLESHNRALFAGIGYKNDLTDQGKINGAQVLMKESRGSAWKLDAQISSGGRGRISCLKSVTFKTDKDGNLLRFPVSILLASPEDGGQDARIFSRNDETGEWIEMIVESGIPDPEKACVNLILGHHDTIAGVDYVFACVPASGLYRGAYDPGASGRIAWESVPEFTCTEPINGASVANGVLHVTAGSNGNPDDDDGGLFKRIDGLDPSWEFIYEWEKSDSEYYKMSGLTSVPDPYGTGYEVLVCARNDRGIIERIDPVNDYEIIQEFDFKSYFEYIWDGLGDDLTVAAYDTMTTVYNPKNGEAYNLIGLRISHPENYIPPYKGAYYLVRHQDGSYEWGYIFDPSIPEDSLHACRTIAVSPFSEDVENAFYFGGYDAEGEECHNSAWIYRGELFPDTCEVSPFAYVHINTWNAFSGNERAIEVTAKVENFSSSDVDFYAAIEIDDNFFWYPDWNDNAAPTSIQDFIIWKESLLSTYITEEIKNKVGSFSIYAGITEQGTLNLLDWDIEKIDLK